MKATIEFELPEDKLDLDMFMKAGEYYATIFDIHNLLRDWYKYDADMEETLNEIRELIDCHELI